ncbi:MAG TPA: hypothetical protein VHC90_10880, partial [Bryobacteraceae bacterium]|nr:hypothetical protein [Bryobacteraceae bacterium]
MKLSLFALGLALGIPVLSAAAVWQPQAGHRQISLWPKTPPDARPNQAPETMDGVTDDPVAGKPWTEVKNVSQPTMTV